MRSLAPVVWREGMHIAQHHLQSRDRYFEDSAAFAFSSLFFEPYGVVGLDLDHDALLNGTASLLHARGVMPDGLPFCFPDEPAPEPLEVEALFSPTRDSHLLLLTIPPFRPGRANTAVGTGAAAGGTRFVAETRRMPDETTGQDEKPVTVARKNFRLALDVEMPEGEEGEESEERVTLPVARIRRDGSGSFKYDPSYVPPSLQIGASSRLLELLHRLIEVMEAKAESLASERAAGASEFVPDEVASFWLAHAIHSSLPPLRHHLSVKTSHPNALYRELLRLAGALCTFSMDSDPRGMPVYDHAALSDCFDAMDRHVRRHLEVVLPRRANRITLAPREEYLLCGTVPDPRSLGDAHWFLEVTTAGSRKKVVADVPRLVKVCSAKHVARLVQSAHPGLGLEHVSSPPAAIAPRMGSEYFRIETTGNRAEKPHPCWTSIVDSREVGVYTPEALASLEFAILVVQTE